MFLLLHGLCWHNVPSGHCRLKNICIPVLKYKQTLNKPGRRTMFIVLQQKTTREPNTIWREGTHEGKKGKSKNENNLLQRMKMGNC